ncbi:AI-2E family transporter [Teichococcus vastitatis]|uniref:AI-2E family transporter n=1 Tax=Teichococcus vastitatis TaxID=2307076 RepID=A0ABS9WDR2_9PROT|nr:AI-2E family transporter [Pseudoroseomonas vastitatis]MCI0757015.1 AI-2E family transporter [Pseudoroseomonas vastitatis]
MILPQAASAAKPGRALQNGLLSTALIIAGLYFGRDVIVPLVLAVLLAFVLAPVVTVLRRVFLPNALAVVLSVLLGAGAILGIGMVMARQAGSLVSGLPAYQENLRQKLQNLHLAELMQEVQLVLQDLRSMVGDSLPSGARSGGHAAPAGNSTMPPDLGTTPLEVIQGLAGPVLAPLATAGVVVLFAIFVLLYREDLRDRVIRLAGSSDLHRTTVALNDTARRLSRLFLAQVALNAALGAFIGVVLWLLGLPSAALWGILAGLMRFVPFLGLFIALIPPLLLAVAVDPGWGLAIWVLVLFLLAEPMMGHVLEPMVFGRSTGLSPVAVVIAAVFWTFIWGPIGLLLAMPLTVVLVVLGRHVPSLGFLDVMLGDRPSLRPEESFYQRSLQGNAAALLEQARLTLREAPSLTAYLDGVALPALALADHDWSREELEPERLDQVRVQTASLLDAVQKESPVPELPADAPLCLCAAGRGRLDDLSASIAALALQSEGVAAAMTPEGAELPPDLASRTRLCCISVLEEGSSAASVRLMIRRWEKALPEAGIAIGVWHARPDSAMLAQLRQETTGHPIVTSLGELAALWRASAGQAARAETPA